MATSRGHAAPDHEHRGLGLRRGCQLLGGSGRGPGLMLATSRGHAAPDHEHRCQHATPAHIPLVTRVVVHDPLTDVIMQKSCLHGLVKTASATRAVSAALPGPCVKLVLTLHAMGAVEHHAHHIIRLITSTLCRVGLAARVKQAAPKRPAKSSEALQTRRTPQNPTKKEEAIRDS